MAERRGLWVWLLALVVFVAALVLGLVSAGFSVPLVLVVLLAIPLGLGLSALFLWTGYVEGREAGRSVVGALGSAVREFFRGWFRVGI